MKTMIVTALLVLSQMTLAAGAKVERELSREKAKQIMDSKETASKEKYLGDIARLAGTAGKVDGLSLNIKKALLQGDVDLLVLVYKATAKEDAATLKFIGEASGGVKTAKEANALSKLAEMSYTGNFKAEVLKEVEQGKSLSDAVKAASKTIGKTGKDEITLEKLLECLV